MRPASSRWPAPILDGRLLIVPLGERCRTLSWATVNGGFARAAEVVWRQVDDQELGLGVDPEALLTASLEKTGLGGAVGLLTARALGAFEEVQVDDQELSVRAVATVGLGNALAVGDPPGPLRPVGTINLLCQLSRPLTDEAFVEAVALASEARTAALLAELVPSRRSGRPATGTGTDCIVVAAPAFGAEPERWVGKHTRLGALVGRAALQAVERGARAWLAELEAGA